MSTLLVEAKPLIEIPFHNLYGNFIGGTWVPPVSGRYFDNISPVDGRLLCRVPRSDIADVEVESEGRGADGRRVAE